MPIIIPANSAASGGFQVPNSTRFNQASSDYLRRSLGTTTSQQKGTFSYWVKRSDLGDAQVIYSNEVANDNNRGYFQFESNDSWRSVIVASGSTEIVVKTNRLFRDVSAWYHIVVRIDTTQSTSTNRLRLYVNGVQETSFQGYQICDQNATLKIFEGGQTNKNLIAGIYASGSASSYFGGYLSEFVYCDGQTLDPTSFGEFDEDSGIWKPIDVSGLTFGNMGFYLDFKDSSALGNDAAGSNNWSVVNLTALDQTTDTCTNNFATLNLVAQTNASVILKEGNTKMSITGNVSQRNYMSTIAMTSGKWYFEALLDNIGTDYSGSFPYVGVMAYESYTGSQYVGTTGGAGYNPAGYIYSNNGSGTNTGTTYTSADVIGCALDLDNSKIYWSKNGTYVSNGSGTGNPSTGANGYDIANIRNGDMGFAVSGYKINAEWACNFGNPYYSISSSNSDANDFGNFEYAVPSGYLSLNTKNLSEELS